VYAAAYSEVCPVDSATDPHDREAVQETHTYAKQGKLSFGSTASVAHAASTGVS
jgi:hypothetical protein